MKYVKRNGSLQDKATLEHLNAVVAEQQGVINAILGIEEADNEQDRSGEEE